MDFPAPRDKEECNRIIAGALALPIHRFVGLRLVSFGAGHSHFEFDAGQDVLTQAGTLHGGVISLAMELPAFTALITLIPRNLIPTTIDFHSQPMRSIGQGDVVRLLSNVLRHGRRQAFCEVEAWVGDRLFAKGQVLKALLNTVE